MSFGRGIRREDGAIAVEFAVLLPLLVIILFATITFGLWLSRLVSYVGAAREGARYAAVHCRPEALQCTDGLVGDRVVAAAAGNPVDLPVSVSTDCTDTPGQPVTVSWSQVIEPLPVPFLGDLFGLLSAPHEVSASFRCE